MRRLQPVVWSKGTFLSPQHLQVQDRFLESTLEFRLSALSYRPWGFRELRIDQEALAGGSFAISSAAGILPDGLPFEIPESDPAPPPRPLAPSFDAEHTTSEVYLAIPHYRERGLNVSVEGTNADTRYLADVVMVRDENSGLSEKPLQIARKSFRFLMEGEPRQGYSALRIANIKQTPSGTFELDSTFVPPLLDISASDYLVAILRRLVEILTAKSATLGGMRRQKNQSLADFTASDIANFWLLFTVNNYFPLLRHVFETKKGHPEVLFTTMTALAGTLTTFSQKYQPRDLPTYDHDDLTHCFTDLDEKLRELLETVVPSNFISLPLKLVQPSIYATALADDKYLRNTKLYLAISAEMKEADLIKLAPRLIKVGSANQIETFIRQALPGIRLLHMTAPPASIPIKMNYQYFSLNQSGEEWDAVGRARNLAAYVPADFPNPQLELLILLPKAA
ncbi:MAG TPA: type VI secretion system baseplate subunit TssK [Terriglobia bacterium]|nr:type VI secretion system baseplate subunit TssK [Terriglobia bacterium]